MTPRRHRAVYAAAVVAMAALAAGCGSSGHSATPGGSTQSSPASSPPTALPGHGPRVAVHPASGLNKTQTVQYSAAGFPAGEELAVTECADHGHKTSAQDCNSVRVLRASTSGTISGVYTVSSSGFGTPNIVCGKPVSCLLSVSELSPTGLSATQTLSFSSGG